MARIDVALPEPMKTWVDERVKSGAYSDTGAYVRELIRRDQQAREELVQALIDGETSGASPRTVNEIARDTRTKLENGEL